MLEVDQINLSVFSILIWPLTFRWPRLSFLRGPIQYISKAVTNLISDKKLFKDIEGRAWGLEFGVLTHKVFEAISQHLFIRKDESIDTDKLISTYQTEMGIPFDELDINELKESCKKFLKHPLVGDIKEADSIATEVPFVWLGNYHGIMDLLIHKGESVTVVDWKSDKLKVKEEEIKQHYGNQLKLYEKAVSEIIGKEVKGLCCYVNLLK
jgi:ATP-dependent exoDNAse (exonuclease V) beta subunit